MLVLPEHQNVSQGIHSIVDFDCFAISTGSAVGTLDAGLCMLEFDARLSVGIEVFDAIGA